MTYGYFVNKHGHWMFFPPHPRNPGCGPDMRRWRSARKHWRYVDKPDLLPTKALPIALPLPTSKPVAKPKRRYVGTVNNYGARSYGRNTTFG